MADLPALSIDEITTAIVDGLAAAHAGVSVIAYRPEDPSAKPPTPAVLLELVEINPGINDGSGRTAVELRFDAYVLIGGFTAERQRALRALAMGVIRTVKDNRWGARIGPAVFLGSFSDEWRPELETHDAWRIEFMHAAQLADVTYHAPDETADPPGSVFFGLAPENGPDNLDKYVEVEGEE